MHSVRAAPNNLEPGAVSLVCRTVVWWVTFLSQTAKRPCCGTPYKTSAPPTPKFSLKLPLSDFPDQNLPHSPLCTYRYNAKDRKKTGQNWKGVWIERHFGGSYSTYLFIYFRIARRRQHLVLVWSAGRLSIARCQIFVQKRKICKRRFCRSLRIEHLYNI